MSMADKELDDILKNNGFYFKETLPELKTKLLAYIEKVIGADEEPRPSPNKGIKMAYLTETERTRNELRAEQRKRLRGTE